MVKRNLYLNTAPVEEAQAVYKKALEGKITRSAEEIKVEESLHRVTTSAVYAKCSSPLYNSAAMDGIAVIAARTTGASEASEVTLKKGEDYQVVDTGDPVRLPYDAVIMAEDILETGEGGDTATIIAPAAPWQHVRPIGEDIVAGEMILPGLHKIRPVDIGVLLSGGILKVEVLRKPKVGIIPTGSEIVEPGEEVKEGDIIESNSRMFEAMVRECGGIPDRRPVVADDYEKIKSVLLTAADENDIVLVNAGSSAGTEDYTVHILREIGQVYIHGAAIKPGKPVILATVKGKPVIGLPGYPVSAYIDFQNFVKPVIAMYSGERCVKPEKIKAVLSKRLVSSLKHTEYVRVKVGKVGDTFVASPLARGAGAAMSLVRSDGFCVIDKNSEGMEAGELTEVELHSDIEDLNHTIVSIGSHDLILDILSDLLPITCPGTFLSSTHVGSTAGLMALKRGEAHIAPTHLLDEKTGVYNQAYIDEMFEEGETALIRGVRRIQGIITAKGNPLGIRGIEDLTKVRYINRQRGAGTRVLLDYQLKLRDIDPEKINGYKAEAATHMAVAALVKSGSVDAGMGILSAARALNLDFIPVGEEEYEFAVLTKYLEMEEIQNLLSLLKSEVFRQRVREAGGYDTSHSGEIH